MALAVFERLNAEPWADRTRTELTATGEIMHKPPSASAVDSLTPQEYQVASAVVEGATNRKVASALFLSAKTVEFHLSNVYRKRGVRTRTELAHRFPNWPTDNGHPRAAALPAHMGWVLPLERHPGGCRA